MVVNLNNVPKGKVSGSRANGDFTWCCVDNPAVRQVAPQESQEKPNTAPYSIHPKHLWDLIIKLERVENFISISYALLNQGLCENVENQ